MYKQISLELYGQWPGLWWIRFESRDGAVTLVAADIEDLAVIHKLTDNRKESTDGD